MGPLRWVTHHDSTSTTTGDDDMRSLLYIDCIHYDNALFFEYTQILSVNTLGD